MTSLDFVSLTPELIDWLVSASARIFCSAPWENLDSGRLTIE
jgi:hypothetical protein